MTKDGQTVPTANIPMGGFKLTGLGAGTSATDAAQFGQLQNAPVATLITVSGADTITGTLVQTLTAYATGQQFSFVAAGTNTTAVTLNIDGLGAKAVTRTGAVALAAGALVSGQMAIVEYDGTRFQLINANAFTNLTVSGALTVGTTLAVTGVATLTAQPILSSLTASLPVFSDASKGLVSNAMTGTGSVMMSASPTTTGTLTAAAINASGSVTLSGTSFFRSSTTSNSPGTFNFYLAASGIREGTAGDFNIDTYNGGWGARLTVSQAGAVTIPGTLGVTGLITGVAGLVAEDTTAISVAGTGNDIRIGTIGNSAITSTADLFVAYLGSSNPLNPSGVNGSLLLASRNNAGAEVVLAATNTVSLRAKSSGVTIPGTLGLGNAGNSGIQLYVTATGTKYGLYMDGSSGVMLYSGINSQTFTSGESATNSALYVRKDSTSSRSISAAGTINASGADYAEYESNGGLVIAKGDVVGFSADGVLTLKFSEAVRFGIKSTNPSYVGGDTFASADALGEHPRHAAIGNEDADEAELAEDIAAYELRLEAARQLVDRVAYSGKVPVNVLDATAGGYIIASDDGGKIAGAFVADVNFEQYKRVVGRVNRVLPDGRAEVAVIVH